MYSAQIIQDSDGQLVLPFEEHVLAELGWEIGDTLQWYQENNAVYIKKGNDNVE